MRYRIVAVFVSGIFAAGLAISARAELLPHASAPVARPTALSSVSRRVSSTADPAAIPKQWGVLAQLAGKSWGFGNLGFATYRWVKPGETLVGTVRTLAGTYQTAYILRGDGTIAGLRKLTETAESTVVVVSAAPDHFSAADMHARYSCGLARSVLTCTDEVSADGKRWSARSSLKASEINDEQLRVTAVTIPSGFPDWKPGSFDPRLGAFEKLSTQVWISPESVQDHELRFRVERRDAGAVGVDIGQFDTAGNPTRYFSIYSEPTGPLKSVLDFSVDPKHPAWDVESRPGALSSTGDASIFVDGNLWRFSISPDQRFAMLETYNGTRQREDRLTYRRIYRAVLVPQEEMLRWHSLSHLFNNFYQQEGYFVAWRWIASGKVLVSNYFQDYHKPYKMSYCILSLDDHQSVSGTLPCVGRNSDGSSRNSTLRDVTDDSFTWSGERFHGRNQTDGWHFQNAAGVEMSPASWVDTSYMKIGYEREQAKNQAHDEYREREHRQQAELQTLYNGLSLLANQTMAATGRTTTFFDASPEGVPAAPLAYDAGGVYGQATADGGYYVGHGLSSREVEAFQASEKATGNGSTAVSASVTPASGAAEAGTTADRSLIASNTRDSRPDAQDPTQAPGSAAPKKGTSPASAERPIYPTLRTTNGRHYYGITNTLELFGGQWMPVDNIAFAGVAVFAMFRQELKDQIISQLRIENHNRYPVIVGITPRYQCQGKSAVSGMAMTLTLAPGEKVNGQDAGLYDYPCPGPLPPESIGYAALSVKRVD